MDEFISGERIQEICDIYCGTEEDLLRNPRIALQKEKHKRIDLLIESWDNPSLIFCYSCSIPIFMSKLPLLRNKFVLVSHNEDLNIDERYKSLADYPLLIKWYCQNSMLIHEKVVLIPIGIANSMWIHGNLETLYSVKELTDLNEKTNDFYFFFNVDTNPAKRQECKNSLESKGLVFGTHKPHYSYLIELASHRFAICPEGNGIDSHRIWECYYLGVIPILKYSTFTAQLQRFLPCILLTDWNLFSREYCISQYAALKNNLQYMKAYSNISHHRNIIRSHLLHEKNRLSYYVIHGNIQSRELDITSQFNKFGIHLSDVTWIRYPNREDKCLDNLCINPLTTRGNICCTYKHYLVLKDIVERNLDMAVVIEDNVSIYGNVPNAIEKYLNEVSSDWDCIFDSDICGLHFIEGPISPAKSLYKKSNDETAQCAGASRGCNFVIINKKAAQVLYSNYMPIVNNADFQYNHLFRKCNLTSYWPEPVNAGHSGKASTT